MFGTDTKRVKICKYSVTNSRFEDDYQHHFIFSHNESQHLRDPKHCDQNLKLFLREINFGECRSSKTTIFVILGALNFVDVVNFSFEKCKNSQKV